MTQDAPSWQLMLSAGSLTALGVDGTGRGTLEKRTGQLTRERMPGHPTVPLVFMLVSSTLTQASPCTHWHSERGRGLPKVTQQISGRVGTRTQVSCLSAQARHQPETRPRRGSGSPCMLTFTLEFC